MTKNILKIVFLGLFGFAFLVYLTANKPKYVVDNENITTNIGINLFPKQFELVGENRVYSRD
ncbi:MAG: hypothetical protein ACNI3C_10695 [Candidatus Marinarcus sp.]|uniref:hypothetical protein n=1 Tax=Candidatus Marinarcus sp. TaxID=3100987 RepID=UPI003B00C63C